MEIKRVCLLWKYGTVSQFLTSVLILLSINYVVMLMVVTQTSKRSPISHFLYVNIKRKKASFTVCEQSYVFTSLLRQRLQNNNLNRKKSSYELKCHLVLLVISHCVSNLLKSVRRGGDDSLEYSLTFPHGTKCSLNYHKSPKTSFIHPIRQRWYQQTSFFWLYTNLFTFFSIFDVYK